MRSQLHRRYFQLFFTPLKLHFVTEGHRASDWPKDPTWTGKLKIVAKGKVAAIILMDASNQVFAICQVTDDAAVERTLDSGRYFVLRITNAQGRHAFIGIAFNERNDAFDFNVALNEFKNELEREELASKLSEVPVGPMKDLSLKEGEKIKIKIVSLLAQSLAPSRLLYLPLSFLIQIDVEYQEEKPRRRR